MDCCDAEMVPDYAYEAILLLATFDLLLFCVAFNFSFA
jgi:hypothetical protein